MESTSPHTVFFLTISYGTPGLPYMGIRYYTVLACIFISCTIYTVRLTLYAVVLSLYAVLVFLDEVLIAL